MNSHNGNTPPDMHTRVKCEMCDWVGELFACLEKETHHISNTNHHFTCPDCGSDVYNWVEDKHLECADERDGEPDSPQKPRRPLGTDSEEEVK